MISWNPRHETASCKLYGVSKLGKFTTIYNVLLDSGKGRLWRHEKRLDWILGLDLWWHRQRLEGMKGQDWLEKQRMAQLPFSWLHEKSCHKIDFDDETVLETAGFIIECLPFGPMCCQTGACSRDGTCAKKEEVWAGALGGSGEPPLIMEVENAPFETKLVFQGSIFHFHDWEEE